MQKSEPRERAFHALEKIPLAISSLEKTLERLYEDWKFPVQTPAEQMEPQWKIEREKQQLDILKRQNTILLRTVFIAVIGIAVTALVGVADLVLKIVFNR